MREQVAISIEAELGNQIRHPLPRDSQHIADELHIALRNAGIKPPYVVVGASLEASMRAFSPTRTRKTSQASYFSIRPLKIS
jgi:hypothetical protein